MPDKRLEDIKTLKCFLPSKHESVFMIREDGSYLFYILKIFMKI